MRKSSDEINTHPRKWTPTQIFYLFFNYAPFIYYSNLGQDFTNISNRIRMMLIVKVHIIFI